MKRRLLKTKEDIRKAIMQGRTIIDGYDNNILTMNFAGNVAYTQQILNAIDTIVNSLYETGYDKYIYIDEEYKIFIKDVEEMINLLASGTEVYEEDYETIRYNMHNSIIYAYNEENDTYNLNPEIIFKKDKFYYKGNC